MSTPAVSAVIRKRGVCFILYIIRKWTVLLCFCWIKFSWQANGGFIMSASHNPGGPEYDWGIKVSMLLLGYQISSSFHENRVLDSCFCLWISFTEGLL